MRKVFFLFLGLILLVGAAVAAIVLFVPLDSLRAPLERAVSNALGREVHVAGGLHASLYPEIGLSASDVSIANVPGGQAAAFAHVGTLAVGAKLMPLFSREIDITTLTLEDPEIHLEVDKAGNANWNFHFAGSGGSSTQSSRLSVSGLKISNGTVSYFDARTGKQKILSAANVSFDLAALDQPAVFSVDATYNGEKLTATGRVDSPDSYTQKMPTKILLDLKSRLINLHFDGTVVGATQNDGTVAISGPSLRELIEGTGTQLKTGGLGPFSVAGAISTKNRIYALKDAKIALDDMHASVDLAVDMNGTVPSLKGNVALDKLNVGTYMIAGQPAPASPGWSTAPLSLSGLKEANADIAISVGNLTLGTFAISQGAMTVALQGGILTANLTKVGLFGGTASGRLVADGSGTVPVFALKSDVSGVAMQTLLQSAMKINRIAGTGTLAMDVTGRGANQQAIMNSLHGTGSVTVKNGAIQGVDLAAVARTVQNALSGSLGAATADKASTDFAEAGGSFAITDGVMHNTDFHLLNPFVRITGNGDINLGQRTLDFHVEPKLVTTQQGQGGAKDATGLGIPFEVSGPWTKISYKPDMKALPGALLNQAASGGLSSLLGNLGGKKSSDTTAPQKSQGFNLGSLFGH